MKRTPVLVGLLLAPWLAQADGFNYSYFEGGIASADIDVGPLDVDADGLVIGGSYGITDELYLFGSYEEQDFDFGIDGDVLMLGAGFYTGISQDLDFVADLAYVDAEVSTGFGSADESGYAIRAGIRSRLSDAVELDAGLRYVDIDDSDTLIGVSGRYYFNESVAVGGAFSDGDNGSTWSVLIRVNFGNRQR